MKRLQFGAIALALLAPLVFAADEEKPEPGFNEATFEGLEFRSIGPAFMSGRIADIAIDPDDQSTWYVGVGSGGIWQTANAGITWETIFDDEVPEGALDIKIFKADHTAFSKKLNKVIMMSDAPDHTRDDWVFLSGTKVREMLSRGEELPVEFSRPEVAHILMDYYQSTVAEQ